MFLSVYCVYFITALSRSHMALHHVCTAVREYTEPELPTANNNMLFTRDSSTKTFPRYTVFLVFLSPRLKYNAISGSKLRARVSGRSKQRVDLRSKLVLMQSVRTLENSIHSSLYWWTREDYCKHCLKPHTYNMCLLIWVLIVCFLFF